MLLGKSGEIAPERMKRLSQSESNAQLWMWLVLQNKTKCCKEQYCIGTWNVRSMYQGKLKVVKQEMAKVNIIILGISELKLTGMGEFTSDDLCIYYYGWESLKRNRVAFLVNKRVQNAAVGCKLKNDRMISLNFQGKPFSITEIQVYAPTTNAEEAEVEQQRT